MLHAWRYPDPRFLCQAVASPFASWDFLMEPCRTCCGGWCLVWCGGKYRVLRVLHASPFALFQASLLGGPEDRAHWIAFFWVQTLPAGPIQGAFLLGAVI